MHQLWKKQYIIYQLEFKPALECIIVPALRWFKMNQQLFFLTITTLERALFFLFLRMKLEALSLQSIMQLIATL